jgi:hypothetical protein
MKSKSLQIILGISLLFVSIGALPAGYSMITQPDGKALGMSLDFLKNSPFHSFFIPGIFLFIINGVFNLIAGILCFFKYRNASKLGLILGIFMLMWIAVQVYSIGLTSFMQPLFFGIGLFEIIISIILIKTNK